MEKNKKYYIIENFSFWPKKTFLIKFYQVRGEKAERASYGKSEERAMKFNSREKAEEMIEYLIKNCRKVSKKIEEKDLMVRMRTIKIISRFRLMDI